MIRRHTILFRISWALALLSITTSAYGGRFSIRVKKPKWAERAQRGASHVANEAKKVVKNPGRAIENAGQAVAAETVRSVRTVADAVKEMDLNNRNGSLRQSLGRIDPNHKVGKWLDDNKAPVAIVVVVAAVVITCAYVACAGSVEIGGGITGIGGVVAVPGGESSANSPRDGPDLAPLLLDDSLNDLVNNTDKKLTPELVDRLNASVESGTPLNQQDAGQVKEYLDHLSSKTSGDQAKQLKTAANRFAVVERGLDRNSEDFFIKASDLAVERNLSNLEERQAVIEISQDFIDHIESSVASPELKAEIRADVTTQLEKWIIAADVATALTPYVSEGRDLIEMALGWDLFTQEDLEGADYGLAAAGLLVPGGIEKIGKLIKKYGPEAVEALGPLGVLVDSTSRAGWRDGHLNSLLTSARNVTPELGDKYVTDLPDLQGSLKEAFDGHIFKGTYEPGEILFQAQRTGQTSHGNWFGPIKPLDSDHAEAMFNIRKWGNDAGQVKAFIVKERVSGYAGKVAGGEGHQFYIPRGVKIEDVVKEVK